VNEILTGTRRTGPWSVARQAAWMSSGVAAMALEARADIATATEGDME
jgi:hypothetical protein